jgi:hypothetical protein
LISEITKAEMQNEEQQLIVSSIRIKENGVTNHDSRDVIYNNRKSVTFEKNNHLRFRSSPEKYNEGVAELNQFIAYKTDSLNQ